MLLIKQKKLGKLDITIYDFENVDDELEEHVHDEKTVHISIVGRGKLLSFGPGWEKELTQGQLVDWKPGQRHGFIALEPNSRLINIVK